MTTQTAASSSRSNASSIRDWPLNEAPSIPSKEILRWAIEAKIIRVADGVLCNALREFPKEASLAPFQFHWLLAVNAKIRNLAPSYDHSKGSVAQKNRG